LVQPFLTEQRVVAVAATQEVPSQSTSQLARSPAWQSDSKRSAPPRFEVFIGLSPGSIQSTGDNVGLNLTVPLIRDKVLEPVRETGQVVS
jgi:hypothetical protein